MVDQFQPQWSFFRGSPSSRSRAVEAPRSEISRSRPSVSSSVTDAPPPLVLAVAVAGHPVSHHRPEVDRHVGLDVRPVLHHPPWPGLRRPADQVDVVGTHPGVERHVVGPLQHVDRVDLQHAGARQGAREGAHGRLLVGRVEEALGRQRDPTRLGLGEGAHALNLTAGTPTRGRGVLLGDDLWPWRASPLAASGPATSQSRDADDVVTEPPGRWPAWPRPARWWCCSARPTPSPPAPPGPAHQPTAPTEAWTPPPSSSTASSAASSRRPWNSTPAGRSR